MKEMVKKIEDAQKISEPQIQELIQSRIPKKYHYTKTPGRPSKYKPEYCQEIIDFFDVLPYEDKEIPHYKGKKVTWTDYKRMSLPLPTLVGFAKHLKISYPTVHNWTDMKHPHFHEEFFTAFTRARELQKDVLIQGGLSGVYNPLFAKFVAINITDMKDEPLLDQSTHFHFVVFRNPKAIKEENASDISPREIIKDTNLPAR